MSCLTANSTRYYAILVYHWLHNYQHQFTWEFRCATEAGYLSDRNKNERTSDGSCLQIVEAPVENWSPPDRGVVKINTNTAFLAETGNSAAGVVARDYRGRVLASICKKLPLSRSVEELPSSAFRQWPSTLMERWLLRWITKISQQNCPLKPQLDPHAMA